MGLGAKRSDQREHRSHYRSLARFDAATEDPVQQCQQHHKNSGELPPGQAEAKGFSVVQPRRIQRHDAKTGMQKVGRVSQWIVRTNVRRWW